MIERLGTKVVFEDWVTIVHTNAANLGIHEPGLEQLKRVPSEVTGWGDKIRYFSGRYVILRTPIHGLQLYVKRCYVREVPKPAAVPVGGA